MLIQNSAIKNILKKYELVRALMYFIKLSDWDARTYMPEAGASLRGDAHAQIHLQIQKLMLDPEFIASINALEHETLNDTEAGIFRALKREITKSQKIPEDAIIAWEEATSAGSVARQSARKNNDFSIFQPHLEKIVDLCLQKAEFLGYTDHPYDALLNEYEEGLTTKAVDAYFDTLRGPLQELMKRVRPEFLGKTGLEMLPYDTAKLKELTDNALNYLGFDPKRIRVDTATHPFCSGITSQEVRITNRREKEFHNTLFGTLHEFGHALYELESDPELDKTPIGGGTSLVIHESQSRFRENIVGRGKAFTKKFLDGYQSLGTDFGGYDLESMYHNINHVEPSLIRVDADEITYHFHIMIRYEVEKALMEKKLAVKDLPAYWNKMYKEYLGVDVPSDAMGVLQDVHRSFGGIGYFPTYSMGTALSAIWKEAIEKEYGPLEDIVGTSEGIAKIKGRLKEYIHQYGSVYTLPQLMEKHTLQFSAAPLLAYLEKKYC